MCDTMIIAPDWIWLHIPKTGGTTTEHLLRQAFGHDPAVRFDAVGPGNPVIWHHDLEQRHASDPAFAPGGRRVVGNIRRLPHWLLSRIHFEVGRFGNKAMVSRRRVLEGCFRDVPRQGGMPGPVRSADATIAPFARAVTEWVRAEHLIEDLSRVFRADLQAVPRDTALNRGAIAYIRELSFWFTPGELAGIYARNPVWAGIERAVYGDVLQL